MPRSVWVSLMRLFQFSFVLSLLFRPGENFCCCFHFFYLLPYYFAKILNTEREECFDIRKTYFQLDRKPNH